MSPGETKTIIKCPFIIVAPVPRGGTAEDRVAIPTPATSHAETLFSTARPGAAVCGGTFITVVPDVFAPFINVSAHIVQSQGVWTF